MQGCFCIRGRTGASAFTACVIESVCRISRFFLVRSGGGIKTKSRHLFSTGLFGNGTGTGGLTLRALGRCF